MNMDKLTNSLEFNRIELLLTQNISQLLPTSRDPLKWRNSQDLWRLLNNIRTKVSDLSKLEVSARQHHKPSMTAELLNSINEDIEHLDQLITFATLLS